MKESTNINRQLYLEWFPQIMYNHHQTGPAGAVLFAPPFRDPFNYHFDPLIPLQIDMVGAAMHSRFAEEGKPGATMRSGASYSTWYNGGLRTTTYFHNMIGLLTETIGSPTPMEVPLVPARQLPTGDLPYPVPPQTWHFRQSIEYSMTANRAVLDLASKYREDFLYNIYRMGRNSIQKGSQDSWTVTPQAHRSAESQSRRRRRRQRLRRGQPLRSPEPTRRLAVLRSARGRGPGQALRQRLHDPAMRDPRGYIIPPDQAGLPDRNEVHQRADQERHHGSARDGATFEVAGKQLSGGFLGGEDRAGVPPAHSRHVRAAGSSQRLSVIPADRRFRPTTSPATRWPIRWA